MFQGTPLLFHIHILHTNRFYLLPKVHPRNVYHQQPNEAASTLRAKQMPLPRRPLRPRHSNLNCYPSTQLTSLAPSPMRPPRNALPACTPAAGSTRGGPDISDMLLESLVACFGVTVRAVSTSMGIPVSGGSITAEGDLDFRGTLGVKAEDGSNVSVGF